MRSVVLSANLSAILISLLSTLVAPNSAVAAIDTVTTTADSGPGSLRDVIASAMPNDSIMISKAISSTPILLTSGSIQIDRSLTIFVENGNTVLIRGNGKSRIFEIVNSEFVFISNLTFQNGYSRTDGGALHTTGGRLHLTDCTFEENRADISGGAIFADSTMLSISSSIFRNNRASGSGSTNGGGAIYGRGATIAIGQSEMTGNRADGPAANGGAVFVGPGGQLAVIASRFTANQASHGGGAIADASGNSSLTNTILLQDTITDNQALYGGGVYVTALGGLSIEGGMLARDTARSSGGGIYMEGGDVMVSDVDILQNVAFATSSIGGGGGIYSLAGHVRVTDGSMISYNSAPNAGEGGGGIFVDLGTLWMESSTVSNNSAFGTGGGIELRSENDANTIRDSHIDSNMAFRYDAQTVGYGGGLCVQGTSGLLITGSTINSNQAGSGGGGIWNNSPDLKLQATRIEKNSATGEGEYGGGGGIYNLGSFTQFDSVALRENRVEGTWGFGGGIYNGGSGVLFILNSGIVGNRAPSGGGGINSQSDGAIPVHLYKCQVDSNSVTRSPGMGGGIRQVSRPSGGVLDIYYSTINGNSAPDEGGGIWCSVGPVVIANSVIGWNTLKGDGPESEQIGLGGGGILSSNGQLFIDFSSIIHNSAPSMSGDRDGGGILLRSGSGTISRTTISSNSASGEGGGIRSLGRLTVSAVTITGNVADVSGGGISADQSSDTLNVSNTIVAGNAAGSLPDLAVAGRPVVSNGFNLIGITSSTIFTSLPSDVVGSPSAPVDPFLAPLADNGGVTPTHALLCGSPAINQGDPNLLTNDQRDMQLFRGRRDIGAFELQKDCSIGGMENRSFPSALWLNLR